MPIQANVTNNQITASVGESQISVSVSGGVGPTGAQGPAGGGYTLPVATASVLGGVKIGSGVSVDGNGIISVNALSPAWNDITGKPSTFTPSAHASSHGVSGADTITIVSSQVSDFSAAVVAAAPPTTNASLLTSGTLADARLSGNVVLTGDARLSDARAPISHAHGNITNAGAIGSTSGQIVVTTTSGVLTTAASISAGSVSGLAAVATTGSYADLSNVPSTFTPAAHNQAWPTITSTPTTLSGYGITDAAAASHTHTAIQVSGLATVATSGAYADLTGTPAAYSLPTASASTLGGVRIGSGISIDGSGVISASSGYTLPNATTSTLGGVIVGTGLGVSSGTVSVTYGAISGTAAEGNHTHSQLHDRSHAITSSSDHTATAWRAFYSNGSGVITELALGASGTVLTSGGASAAPTFSALPAGGTKSIAKFTPADNQPPSTAFATLDTRNSVLVLEFDAASDESAVFCGYIPEGATLASGLKVRLSWMGDTATSGNVRWGVQLEADGTDLDADSFDTATLATSAANGTSGIETVVEITATSIDSLAAGDRFRLKVYRDADDATNDTMTGDAQLVAVEVQVA